MAWLPAAAPIVRTRPCIAGEIASHASQAGSCTRTEPPHQPAHPERTRMLPAGQDPAHCAARRRERIPLPPPVSLRTCCPEPGTPCIPRRRAELLIAAELIYSISAAGTWRLSRDDAAGRLRYITAIRERQRPRRDQRLSRPYQSRRRVRLEGLLVTVSGAVGARLSLGEALG